MEQVANLIYFAHINSIGGVETFFYNLAVNYSDRDILVVYRTGDDKQLERLRRLVRVVQFRGQKFKCKRAFFNYNADIISNVVADEYIQVIHADYKAQHLKPMYPKKITRYVGVSQHVCETFREVTGFDCELAYPPLVERKPDRVLHLVSATRLTAEKGGWRIKKLARALDDANIPYHWIIFTNAGSSTVSSDSHISVRPPELDISDFVADADWLVQLSDTEAYCFSVVEALQLGTPVIVTKCQVYGEIGLDDSNSIMIDFDMKDIPIDRIYDRRRGASRRKFKYTPKSDGWSELLIDTPTTYDPDEPTRVKAGMRFSDLECGVQRDINDEWGTTLSRADMLMGKGLLQWLAKDDRRLS